MDNYRTLIERKEYDLVITLTEGDLSVEALSYRAVAFLAKGEARKALEIVLTNREELFKYKPAPTMKTNIELRLILRQFDEAYDDLKYYENLPYVSQEVEEYLKALPKIIRTEERNSSLREKYSDDEIREKLTGSSDDYEIISTLNLIGSENAKHYVDEMINLVQSNRGSLVKTYAFLFLIAARSGKEVELKKNGKTYKLVPNQVTPPFFGKSFESFRDDLDQELNDPSVANIAKKLLNDYIFEVFPEPVDLENEHDIYLLAFSYLGHNYLSSSYDIEEKCKEKGIDSQKLLDLLKKINAVREKEETLSY